MMASYYGHAEVARELRARRSAFCNGSSWHMVITLRLLFKRRVSGRTQGEWPVAGPAPFSPFFLEKGEKGAGYFFSNIYCFGINYKLFSQVAFPQRGRVSYPQCRTRRLIGPLGEVPKLPQV